MWSRDGALSTMAPAAIRNASASRLSCGSANPPGAAPGSARQRRHMIGMTALRERAEPPATPLLHALWLGLRGDWAAAHEIAQADDGADAAWVHAWLHRIEGDASNAAYWYRRAGKEVGQGSTDAEGEVIAQALADR